MKTKHFETIMMSFFTVYIFAVLFMVLSLVRVDAVEYVDEFPPEPEFLEYLQTDLIDTCKNGITIIGISYNVIKEPTLLYIEAYRSSDKENPISVMYADYGEVPGDLVIDIYIKNANRIEWYQSPSEFKQAYPNGLCPQGTDL